MNILDALPNAIIAGTGRAGSTSLFRYLTDHPQICGSTTKETQFFIRHMDGIDDSAMEEYRAYFSECNDRHSIRIEATPHYLQFAEKIAPLIHNTLPDVRLIFILRDPVSRLFTGYRNLRELESQTFGSWSFDEFVVQAISNQALADHHAEDPRLRAASYMYTGCYSKYLATYYEVFDPSRICVLFFDSLISSPREFMAQVARFLEIDDRFYDSYTFSQENRTRAYRLRAMHRVAHRLNLGLEPLFNKYPAVRRIARDTYNWLNEAKSKKEVAPENSKTLLSDFYRPYNADLRALLEKHGHDDDLPAWLQR